jgi:hypothetical protein
MVAMSKKIIAKSGGQLHPERPGHFHPEKGGQFHPEKAGVLIRNIQFALKQGRISKGNSNTRLITAMYIEP